jgi:peroxiredoxin
LRPALEEAGIRFVTASTDTAGEIKGGRGMHGLKATMLADPKGDLINQFGVRNEGFNNFRIPGRPVLPVPTTMLVDSNGVIVWIDQTDNYTRRSDPIVIEAAIKAHLPELSLPELATTT